MIIKKIRSDVDLVIFKPQYFKEYLICRINFDRIKNFRNKSMYFVEKPTRTDWIKIFLT